METNKFRKVRKAGSNSNHLHARGMKVSKRFKNENGEIENGKRQTGPNFHSITQTDRLQGTIVNIANVPFDVHTNPTGLFTYQTGVVQIINNPNTPKDDSMVGEKVLFIVRVRPESGPWKTGDVVTLIPMVIRHVHSDHDFSIDSQILSVKSPRPGSEHFLIAYDFE